MSVLIKGIEMPSECNYCPLCAYYPESENVWCTALHILLEREWNNGDIPRREDCPLVEVPIPHGRLIDAKAFHEWSTGHTEKAHIAAQPTVIEAERI